MSTKNNKIEFLKEKFSNLKLLLEIEKKETRLTELRHVMTSSNFWNDQVRAVKVSQEAEELSSDIKVWSELEKEISELAEMMSLVNFEQDLAFEKELGKRYEKLDSWLSDLEFKALFKAKYDKNNAFISIHAGVGGVDAQDWAEMLERMFLRFCERKNFKAKVLDRNYGNEAGIKSSVIQVKGAFAYAYLKSENGTHRLLRNSPFNSDNLRQTSFALVEVIPEMEKEINIELKDEDLKIDVYRSSGPGGQSVNTTDSAVRITHLGSGLVVSCQNERSQYQNKENALNILKNKLIKLEIEKKDLAEKEIKGDNKADWGRQIRSYFLYGNQLVKDHRSNLELTNVADVLDGNLDVFVEAYLKGEIKN